jgi:hypothetical protein
MIQNLFQARDIANFCILAKDACAVWCLESDSRITEMFVFACACNLIQRIENSVVRWRKKRDPRESSLLVGSHRLLRHELLSVNGELR